LQNCLDAQEQLPFMDDSSATTPDSDVVSNNFHSRHSSYTSHASRISYTSHGDGINWSKEILFKPRQRLQSHMHKVSDRHLITIIMSPHHAPLCFQTLPNSECRLSVSTNKRPSENPFLESKKIPKHSTVNINGNIRKSIFNYY
jgi:voltage-dependent para-like sodium channel (fragment)